MVSKNEGSDKSYIEKAIESLTELASNNQIDMMESFNRTNKGELFVLHFLTLSNTQVLPSELSAALHSSTARISALLGALEKKGQIERDIDKSNRRNILVTVTDAGRKRIETEMTTIKETMTRIFTEMGEADTLEFVRLSSMFFKVSQKHMIDCMGNGKNPQSG
jgi:DNA-binding MarR family transcriptional regulator